MIHIPQTPQEQLLKEIALFLHKADIPYMVTGSLSVIRYGRIRASHDIDFIIEANIADQEKIITSFASLPKPEFVVDIRQVGSAVKDKTQFNIFHLPTSLKLDFWLLTSSPFDEERFKRRKELPFYGVSIMFSSPEDTILKKLLWYKESMIEKHLIDAAFVYQLQVEHLDMQYLTNWSKLQETENFLETLKKINLEEHY